MTDCKELPPIQLLGSVIAVADFRNHTLLAFSKADGSVEFWDRATMLRISPDPASTTIHSMAHAGFEFQPTSPGMISGFSDAVTLLK